MKSLLLSAIVVAISLTALCSYSGQINQVLGQDVVAPTFANNTETISDLENILGSDQHIIINGTDIANPDNTLPDSITVNIAEDCMQLLDSSHMYCP